MHSRIGCSVVCLSVLSITAGCCFSPATEEPNDLPSTAPHLNGTWEAVVDGEMMLQMYLDSTGDPIWASVSPTLIEGGLPVDLPDPILLGKVIVRWEHTGFPLAHSRCNVRELLRCNP